MTTTTVSDLLISRERRMKERLPLDIDLGEDGRKIKVRHGKPFDFICTEADVQEYNGRFIEILEKVRRDVTKLGKNVNRPLLNGEKHLEELRQAGVEAYALLPKGLGERIQEQEQAENKRGISLDFTFPVPMAFLWEMIYTGDTQEALDFEKFWGFRYPIGHLDPNSSFNLKRLVKLQRGILATAHNQLLYSQEELEQLEQKMRELRERLRLAVDVHRLEKVIPSEMGNCKELIKFFTDKTFDYGVVHFACHCANPDAQGVSRAYLSFTAHQEVEMTLGLFSSEARFNRGFLSRPLIFMNACESGTPLRLQSLNFPSVLINFGASGVIATACTMPDNFASAFATKFYSQLFDKYLANPSKGDTLREATNTSYTGEALWETNRYFWQTYQNPLGLAYGLYAESNQELEVTDS